MYDIAKKELNTFYSYPKSLNLNYINSQINLFNCFRIQYIYHQMVLLQVVILIIQVSSSISRRITSKKNLDTFQ